ncbi:hypothetical protein [Bradyrhizobium ivorense]|nr:hypothetical protein [Bradyrhizobium ivorense]
MLGVIGETWRDLGDPGTILEGPMDMGLEIIYGVGAFVLLTALIFAVLQYHFRSRRAAQTGDDVTRERYERNET